MPSQIRRPALSAALLGFALTAAAPTPTLTVLIGPNWIVIWASGGLVAQQQLPDKGAMRISSST